MCTGPIFYLAAKSAVRLIAFRPEQIVLVRYGFWGAIRLHHALAFFGECAVRVESLEVIISGALILYFRVPFARDVGCYAIILLSKNAVSHVRDTEASVMSLVIGATGESVRFGPGPPGKEAQNQKDGDKYY